MDRDGDGPLAGSDPGRSQFGNAAPLGSGIERRRIADRRRPGRSLFELRLRRDGIEADRRRPQRQPLFGGGR